MLDAPLIERRSKYYEEYTKKFTNPLFVDKIKEDKRYNLKDY